MESKKEIVIIGAGVIGCSIAYHLAKQGVPSQVIERDSIAVRTSGKAWAIIPYPPGYLGADPVLSSSLLSLGQDNYLASPTLINTLSGNIRVLSQSKVDNTPLISRHRL